MIRRLWAPASDEERLFCGEWVARRIAIPGITGAADFIPYEALCVLADERLVAVVLYHAYQPSRRTIEMTIAADSPLWATRRTILALLEYPFEQLQVNRIGAGVSHRNPRAIRLDKGVGFREEGVLRDAFGPGHHMVVLRMLRADYIATRRKWSRHGKEVLAKGARSIQDGAGADAKQY